MVEPESMNIEVGSWPLDVPPIGAVRKPDTSVGAHAAASVTKKWVIVDHDVAGQQLTELSSHRGGRDAAAAFQKARQSSDVDGHLIEAYRWALGGWLLVDRAPWTRNLIVTDPDGSLQELVLGQHGQAIAVLRLVRPKQWYLLMRDSEDEELFNAPSSVRDAVHTSRANAIARAYALAPHAMTDDQEWCERWARTVRRFLASGIATGFTTNIEILGAIGVRCAAAGCLFEASSRITLTGPDIAPETRIACTYHCAVATAYQQFGVPGDTASPEN